MTPHGDQFGHVEARGIDHIPDAERHGRARELFFVWMAPNIIYLDIILGGAMMKLGLGIWPAIGVIVVGNAYWLLVGPRFREWVEIRNGRRRGHAGHVRRARKSVQCCHLRLGHYGGLRSGQPLDGRVGWICTD